MTAQAIIKDIKSYIIQNGGNYSAWYAGIASNPKQRLFIDHEVDEKNGLWIHTSADSNEVAREVESYFLELGCNGGPGGGDYTSKTVYAYKKTGHTIE